MRMHPVEEILVGYLSLGESFSSLKSSTLLSKPLQTTSPLNVRAYVAADQASGALHMMPVLQEYQADLQRDLDQGQGLKRALSCATPHITEQTDAAIWSINGGDGGKGEVFVAELGGYQGVSKKNSP